jgi:hypothetical protein
VYVFIFDCVFIFVYLLHFCPYPQKAMTFDKGNFHFNW